MLYLLQQDHLRLGKGLGFAAQHFLSLSGHTCDLRILADPAHVPGPLALRLAAPGKRNEMVRDDTALVLNDQVKGGVPTGDIIHYAMGLWVVLPGVSERLGELDLGVERFWRWLIEFWPRLLLLLRWRGLLLRLLLLRRRWLIEFWPRLLLLRRRGLLLRLLLLRRRWLIEVWPRLLLRWVLVLGAFFLPRLFNPLAP